MKKQISVLEFDEVCRLNKCCFGHGVLGGEINDGLLMEKTRRLPWPFSATIRLNENRTKLVYTSVS